MYGANVIIFEGIMAFYNEELCEVGDLTTCRMDYFPFPCGGVLYILKIYFTNLYFCINIAN